jgi:hypothetical protein
MKMLLCHKDLRLVQRLLDCPSAGTNILVHCPTSDHLVSMVAATEPHLVVIGGRDLGASPESLQRRLVEAGFRMPVRLLPGGRPSDKQLDELWTALAASSGRLDEVDFDPETYTVLTEGQFEVPPPRTAVSDSDKERQENRFLALLAGGTENHRRACAYLAAVENAERHHELHWLSAALAGEPTGYVWRNQLFRYLSFFAHYLPGVEVECLPLPCPASTTIEYLHTGLSGEALYAFSAVRAFGIDKGCEQALWKLGQILIRAEDRPREDGARLAGWTRLLHNVTRAHVMVLEASLCGNLAQFAALKTTRRKQVAFQVFCRWWNLTDLASVSVMDRLVVGFGSGRRAAGTAAFDSFYKFTEKIQAQARQDLGLN